MIHRVPLNGASDTTARSISTASMFQKLSYASALFLICGFCFLAPVGCQNDAGSSGDDTEQPESGETETGTNIDGSGEAGSSSDGSGSTGTESETGSTAVQPGSGNENGQEIAGSGESGTTSPESFAASFFMWNVESEGADGNVIAQQISEMPKYHVYALTEVLQADFAKFKQACGDNFDSIDTKSGNNDRMQIIYDTDKFELVRSMELDEINIRFRYRAPLVVHLRDKETGKEFLTMVNHLARGKKEIRQQQAGMLVEWAREQTLPVIALGDYNFDYVFATEEGNDAFRIFMRDGVYKWLQPETMIDTNWYDREGDGTDDYPGSMLDFAFVAQQAMDWDCEFKVIVRDGDFPDDEKTSDHRPCEVHVQSN